MYASSYNLIIPVAEQGKSLVFNTLKGSALLLPHRLAEHVAGASGEIDGLVPGYFRRFERDESKRLDTQKLPHSTIDLLTELGILTESREAESKAVQAWQLQYWNSPVLNLTMAYTAACQLACTYCFQSGCHQQSMHHGKSLQASTLKWIVDYLREHPEIESINLGLFGGEPLLESKIADFYIEQISSIAHRSGKNFSINLTTNGLILRKELISKWVNFGLNYIRVSLDGPPDIHNARRPFKSGEGTFSTILNNLKQIVEIDELGIGISINLDSKNVQRVAELLDILIESGLRDEVEIILEPVLPRLADLGKFDSSFENNNVLCSALTQVIQKGFATPIFPGLCTPCNFVQANSFVIDWTGKFFRCSFTMPDQGMSVGNVEDGISEQNRCFLKARKATEYCLTNNCAYLPLCGGSCRYEALHKSGDFQAVNCPVKFWDKALPLSIPHYFGLRPYEGESRQ